ncbi:MAG: rane protein involved in colicin uptake [Bacteroidetes bacterium]|nr:rane protein involved in colicin uptake [Bacteroidota bacterium]
MDKEYISFDIKTGMKNIIGRDLITDDFIAIYELVKNSYDAYADYVTIKFNDDEIIIADNGKGMSEHDLRGKWFSVAYSAKKDGSEDEDMKRTPHLNKLKSRRFYAGAKGVGRFSCDRLGNNLELVTTHVSSTQTYKVEVDWRQFELDAKQSFGAIKIPLDRISEIPNYHNNQPHGTILKITQLNSLWGEKRLYDLKQSLEKIINPFSSQNDFTIEIVAKEFLESDKEKTPFQQINGKITNSILSVLNIKTTQINVIIKNELITTKLIDRGTLIYHIEENNPYSQYIDDLDISLYYLNRSAKINFGKIMDIEPVNYGNVLLFKNGFRVQPYGQFGDDSWKIDQRKQQGYNRRLGTRDLFGRVDIITENFEEFKEVSSRDGGLVETVGKKLLFEIFSDKAFGRLERYVVGVLWGEGFKRKNYFVNEEIAQQIRDNLDNDKDKDSYEDITNNLGSKIDFVNLIKSLSDEKDVKIIAYNKDLVDLVNAQLDIVQPKFISELERIAEKTNDLDLLNQVKLTEENFNKIVQEKEDAIIKAQIEEKQRIEAEKKAREEELKRIEAEKRQKEEEEKRHQAELATANKEKERLQAELDKLNAEKRAKEEEEKRRIEATARVAAEAIVQKQKEQITRFKAGETVEYKDLRDSNHIIGVYSDDISKKILLLKRKLDKGQNIDKQTLLDFIQGISLANEKISTLTRFTTKSGFLKAILDTEEDIVAYMQNYIRNIYQVLYDVDIKIIGDEVKFVRKFKPIELSVALDNILSNSRKKNAKSVTFEFMNLGSTLQIKIRDIGDQLSNEISDWKMIFEEGITTTKGSGLGLSHVKRIIEDELKGTITYNPDYKIGFELIIKLPQ